MTHKVKKEFEALGIELFLHGSRSMLYNDNFYYSKKRDAPEDTDWDYAAQDLDDTRDLLYRTGWRVLSGEEYTDSLTSLVWEKMYGRTIFQIALKHDLRAYKDIWSSIPEDFYEQFLWKRSPTALPEEARRKFFSMMYWAWEAGTFEKGAREWRPAPEVEEGRVLRADWAGDEHAVILRHDPVPQPLAGRPRFEILQPIIGEIRREMGAGF